MEFTVGDTVRYVVGRLRGKPFNPYPDLEDGTEGIVVAVHEGFAFPYEVLWAGEDKPLLAQPSEVATAARRIVRDRGTQDTGEGEDEGRAVRS